MKYGDGFDTFLIPMLFLNAGDAKDKLLLHNIFNQKCTTDKCLAQSLYCAQSLIVSSHAHHGMRSRPHVHIFAT
jgi:hypothetical protein